MIDSLHALIVGIMLIFVGVLSVLSNVADLGAGLSGAGLPIEHERNRTYTYYGTATMSVVSLGVACHGVWCGIPVRTHT